MRALGHCTPDHPRREARRRPAYRREGPPPLTSPPRADGAHPYLRAASAGIRHHARALAPSDADPPRPVDRLHLNVLHADLTALLQLLDRLADHTRAPHPAAGRHLATAHTRLWHATTEVHAAFHLLPGTTEATTATSACHPERPPFRLSSGRVLEFPGVGMFRKPVKRLFSKGLVKLCARTTKDAAIESRLIGCGAFDE
ncbi:DUF6238 family protein [Streptomyces sp. NPDC052079]|uniref:DUF6238 family protein n=1 Tax=Streptomyces sp. NPDC052079 TaxID=3155526 RepID=UPI00343612DA